jgi:3-oxoacyl-[acyl-carrier-protein] synthase III
MNKAYPDPTDKDLNDPLFEAIWQAIKDWDICRDPINTVLYASATGNDVMRILKKVRKALKKK